MEAPFATWVAVAFTLGFYGLTVLGVTRTHRQIGRSPLVILQRGSPEEVAAVFGMWAFPVVLILSTRLPDVALFRPFVEGWGLQAAGGVVILGGLILQYISLIALGEAFRIGLDPDQRELLVRHGPYRYVRHPIYTAFAGFFVGAWLLQPNLAFSLITPLGIARLVLQAVREERLLLGTFGRKYQDYMRATKRFIPGVL